MSFLLDTNACIAIINGRPPRVRERFEGESADGAMIMASSVSMFELWYGVAKSDRPERNAQRVVVLMAGPLEVAQFDDLDAAAAGRLRAELEANGTPIGVYDLLIAGQALRRGLTIVTANTREFARVPELTFEDWTRPASGEA